MNLRDFNDRLVRVETADGALFDGEAVHESEDYCFHEYGVAQEALQIDSWIFYRSEVRSVTPLEGPPALWFSRPLHCMHLAPAPFEKIERGEKTIELRLNDPKRQRIRAGDVIRFEETGGWEDICYVKVTALHAYPSFAALYAALPAAALGYGLGETPDPQDMDAYYSAEAQAAYGVLGIEIALFD